MPLSRRLLIQAVAEEDANPVEAQKANNAHDIELPPGLNESDSQDNDDDNE